MDDLAQIPNRMQESVELTKRVEKLASDATKEILPTDDKSIESIVQSTLMKRLS